MPRPLHRSLLFWSGLFTTLSVLWCWVDSQYYISAFGRTTGGLYLGIHQLPSRIELVVWDEVGATGPGWKTSRTDSVPDFLHEDPFLPFHYRTDRLSPHLGGLQHRLVFPHWFLLLAAVSLWFLLLFLRAGRLRRASSSAPSPRK